MGSKIPYIQQTTTVLVTAQVANISQIEVLCKNIGIWWADLRKTSVLFLENWHVQIGTNMQVWKGKIHRPNHISGFHVSLYHFSSFSNHHSFLCEYTAQVVCFPKNTQMTRITLKLCTVQLRLTTSNKKTQVRCSDRSWKNFLLEAGRGIFSVSAENKQLFHFASKTRRSTWLKHICDCAQPTTMQLFICNLVWNQVIPTAHF